MYSGTFVLIRSRRMREVDSAHPFMLPATAKLILVVQETQLLNNVVHDKVSVDLGLVSHVFFVCLTELTNLIDVKPLIRVYFQHPNN